MRDFIIQLTSKEHLGPIFLAQRRRGSETEFIGNIFRGGAEDF